MLISLLIVSGSLYAGFQVYKKNQQKKRDLPIDKKTSSSLNFQEREIGTKSKISLFLGDELRYQQLEEFSNTKKKISQVEKGVNKTFAVSVISMGIATIGVLFFPPIGILSVPGFIYVSLPIFKNTYWAIFHEKRKIQVHTLTTIVLLTCLVQGFYWIGNLTSFFFIASRKLLIKVKDDSEKGLIDVFKQQPHFVWILVDGVEVKIPFEEVKHGDVVVVNAGETIPIDGTIVDGLASIDQHILTGEAQLVEKEINEFAFAATVVLAGRICIKAEKTGDETTVAKIGNILNQTVSFKSNMQLDAEKLVDKAALPTFVLGILSLPFVGFMGFVSVLNNRLGYYALAVTSSSALNYLRLTSEHGILIKDGRIFDLLNQVDTIIFDKTGTLTLPQPHVGKIDTCSEYQADQVLAYAAAEYRQTHPVALAIVQEAKTRQLNLPEIEQSEYEVGYGIKVMIEQRVVQVGSGRFMEKEDITIPSSIKEMMELNHVEGDSFIMVARANKLIGVIRLLPTIRPEAKGLIQQLKQRDNIKSMYIISGDHEIPTKKLAKKLGIEHYFAEVLPHGKAEIIEKLQQSGKSICYIGDGINDAIALKKAQVSISVRGASTVATDAAQVILMDGNLSKLGYLFDLAKSFKTTMRNTFAAILVPSVIGVFGVFFFNFGLVATTFLRVAGLAGGLTFSRLPLLQRQKWLVPQRPKQLTDDKGLPKKNIPIQK